MSRVRHLRQNAIDALHLRAAADQGAESIPEVCFSRSRRLSVSKCPSLGGALQHIRQFVHAERLGQILARAGAHCLDGRRHRGVRGHHHHDGLRVESVRISSTRGSPPPPGSFRSRSTMSAMWAFRAARAEAVSLDTRHSEAIVACNVRDCSADRSIVVHYQHMHHAGSLRRRDLGGRGKHTGRC